MKAAKVVLMALSAFVAAYVVYAHVASLRASREYQRETLVESFATPHDLERRGALSSRAEGSSTVVDGLTGDAAASLEWRGPPRRLGEILLSMRTVVTGDPIDASIGLEDTRGGKRVAVVLHSDAHATVGLIGADRELSVPLDHPETGHEIALRISPELHLAAFAVDGVFVGSAATSLEAGALVRAFHRVEAAGGERVALRIEDVVVRGIPRDAAAVAFDERFEGKLVDPIRWRALVADGWIAESHFAATPEGLALDARSLRANGAATAGLVGPTFTLRSFRASARLVIERVTHASFFFGVTNTHGGLPQWRAFDSGLLDGAEGLQPFAAGHWERDGQHRLVVFGPVARGELECFVEYDAKTGIGRAGIGSVTLIEKPLDLEPLEDVQLHLGVNLAAVDANARVVVREVRFDPR